MFIVNSRNIIISNTEDFAMNCGYNLKLHYIHVHFETMMGAKIFRLHRIQ